MKNQGVHVLNDTWERFNSEIVLGGLTSSFYHKCEHYDPKVPMKLYPNTNWINLFEKQNGYRILLDHHPENYDQYTRIREIDLILSGHNHGGQIRLLGKGYMQETRDYFPNMMEEYLITALLLVEDYPTRCRFRVFGTQ